ncbi:MAG: NADH-quinone oxidoreductase subunit N [Caldisericaceae bacterium]|nr:NADH-quinone oxidoreductase subunit N [Caldisericaceae bacterium]
MTGHDFLKLMPIIILAATPLIIMLAIAIKRNHLITAVLSVVGLFAALFAIPGAKYTNGDQVSNLFIIDQYALFYFALMFLATIVIIVPSFQYLELRFKGNREEYYLLLLTATFGSVGLAASNHFISFFLSLEILSVSLYALVAYLRHQNDGIEAGLKYLILAAVSSAFLLFGMSLVYSQVGSMQFKDVINFLSQNGNYNFISIAGVALMVVGFGFKLAVVPFHMWSPDVYQGAPAPVSAFIASVSKGGILALLFRFFAEFNIVQSRPLFTIFALIAVFSMFVGNFLALLQSNVKRLLAYSSIAHFGYILVAFIAGNAQQQFKGVEAATFYIVSYFITIIGAFMIIGLISNEEREGMEMSDYRGLYWRHPWLSVALSAMMFSLAGIPLTSGFIAKYYILASGISTKLWTLIIILIINSALGVYYYLRVTVEMFSNVDAEQKATLISPNVGILSGILLAVLTIALVWLGVYPTGLIGSIQAAMF